jgi:GT2 family glycosyltransferase
VDVGVVSWNTAELTAAALRRLMDSDQGCDMRLLVRDNGSSDGTPELLQKEVPEAEIDAGSENLGFAAGVNTIISRSAAPWLFLLNSDAWPAPGAIGRLVEAMAERPRAALVAPRVERPDGTLEHSTFPFPSLRLAATMAFWRKRLSHARADELMLEGDWAHDRSRQVDWAVGAALLMRREALDDVGGFDERYFMYVEDVEWAWRARRKGWEIWFERRYRESVPILPPRARTGGDGRVPGAQPRRLRAPVRRGSARARRRSSPDVAQAIRREPPVPVPPRPVSTPFL